MVVAADDRTGVEVTPPTNRAGHQGLFFERIHTAGDLTAAGALEPGAVGLYYNRNRWYRPELGRFTSMLPNAILLGISA